MVDYVRPAEQPWPLKNLPDTSTPVGAAFLTGLDELAVDLGAAGGRVPVLEEAAEDVDGRLDALEANPIVTADRSSAQVGGVYALGQPVDGQFAIRPVPQLGFTPNAAYKAGALIYHLSIWWSAKTDFTAGASFVRANWNQAAPSLVETNRFNAPQHYYPATPGLAVSQGAHGGNGTFMWGIDTAAPNGDEYRDFYIGPGEKFSDAEGWDNRDFIYIQANNDYATLTGAVTAGGTALALSKALTFTGTDTGGKYWAMIGTGAAGNVQECVEITAGSGTNALTCSALQYPHPSGARVTVLYDLAHQPTMELWRVGSANLVNRKWRLVIRPDTSGYQPDLGALKIEDNSAATAADRFQISNPAETVKSFRVMPDKAVSIQADVTDQSETNGSTTNASTTVQLSSLTATDRMLGSFISGTGIPLASYITAVDTTANTVTISRAATATGSALALTIYRPLLLVRRHAAAGHNPMLTVSPINGTVVRTKLAVGNGSDAGAGIPQSDLDVYGTRASLRGPTGQAEFHIELTTNNGGDVRFKIFGNNMLIMTRQSSQNKIGLYGVTPVAQAAAIAAPTGGSTIDAESRTAINAIRAALTGIGVTL